MIVSIGPWSNAGIASLPTIFVKLPAKSSKNLAEIGDILMISSPKISVPVH